LANTTAWKRIRSLACFWLLAETTPGVLKQLLLDEIKATAEPDREFSAMTKAFLRGCDLLLAVTQ